MGAVMDGCRMVVKLILSAYQAIVDQRWFKRHGKWMTAYYP
jgi:hypothetical protein